MASSCVPQGRLRDTALQLNRGRQSLLGRRSFVTAGIVFIQSAVALVVGWPGLRVLFAPLRRSKNTSSFLDVAPLSVLSATTPVAVTVRADRWDAYAHYPPGPIGRVWLVQTASGDPPTVRCFLSTCPHLGCGISWDSSRKGFSCPCHGAKFDDEGRVLSGPSPRAMDELACRITDPDDKGERRIQVKYQEFRIGTVDQQPMA